MFRDPMFYVVMIATALLAVLVRATVHQAVQELSANAESHRRVVFGALRERVDEVRSLLSMNFDAVFQTLRRRPTGAVLVLGTAKTPDGEKQFAAGKVFTLTDGEQGEFGETIQGELEAGTIVLALGNIMLEGVYANGRTYAPWSIGESCPVAVVPDRLFVGARLQMRVRGHQW